MAWLSRMSPRAHPRSRGENQLVQAGGGKLAGSSPLTRGKPADRALSGKWSGLIPAHAGKTFSACRRANSRWAHPRSRGENGVKKYQIDWVQGSSPLTRGKQRHTANRPDGRWLIPAHAGKTTRPSGSAHWPWAHPRSRGENLVVCLRFASFGGSSPLTRGKLALRARSAGRRRLIPAHAGKTTNREAEPCSPGAHPRSRGENNQPRS